jgi:hypothetical protein
LACLQGGVLVADFGIEGGATGFFTTCTVFAAAAIGVTVPTGS